MHGSLAKGVRGTRFLQTAHGRGRLDIMTATDSEVDIYEDGGEVDTHYKQIYKILIIGDSNVGKTALLTRFVEGRFQSVFMSTVGEVLSLRRCID